MAPYYSLSLEDYLRVALPLVSYPPSYSCFKILLTVASAARLKARSLICQRSVLVPLVLFVSY
jgi:hypothetical protein